MTLTLKDLLPYITTRMTTLGQVYTEGWDKIVCRNRQSVYVGVGESISWLCLLPFHFGVYEADIQVARAGADINNFFGLERHHGYADEGLVAVATLAPFGLYVLWNGQPGAAITLAPAQDWRTERHVKIDWQPNYIRVYVDNLRVAEQLQGIPQESMNLFGEIGGYYGNTPFTASTWISVRNLRVPEPEGWG